MIVEVTWRDAFSQTTSWGDVRAVAAVADDPMVVRSVGFLIAKTKYHVILATSSHDGRCADTMTIPVGCVIRVRRLTKGR